MHKSLSEYVNGARIRMEPPTGKKANAAIYYDPWVKMFPRRKPRCHNSYPRSWCTLNLTMPSFPGSLLLKIATLAPPIGFPAYPQLTSIIKRPTVYHIFTAPSPCLAVCPLTSASDL